MSDVTWTPTTIALRSLTPWERNPKRISKAHAARLLELWDELGQFQTIAIGPAGEVYDGHQRLSVLKAAHGGKYEVTALQSSRALSEKEREKLTVAAHVGTVGAFDWDALSGWDAGDLQAWGFDTETLTNWQTDIGALSLLLEADQPPTGSDEMTPEVARATLAERFIVPPFSVLDARQGYWQERKRAWIALGIDGESGRETALAFVGHAGAKDVVSQKILNTASSTSVFDPVLCEIAYRWFCPKGGLIINPTAGESVYGLVASYLGYRYKGVELRAEQVESNQQQNAIMGLDAEWIQGDGQDVYSLIGEDADFVMCCPPYVDLEVYSEDPRDLSTMSFAEFLPVYQRIISESVRRLKDNRFACFTVGEVRGKNGNYLNFVGATIQAFIDAGCGLYNDAVLVTATGSVPLMASHNFPKGRKLGKTHQNVLFFVKGDWKKAVEACGLVEVYFPNELN